MVSEEHEVVACADASKAEVASVGTRAEVKDALPGAWLVAGEGEGGDKRNAFIGVGHRTAEVQIVLTAAVENDWAQVHRGRGSYGGAGVRGVGEHVIKSCKSWNQNGIGFEPVARCILRVLVDGSSEVSQRAVRQHATCIREVTNLTTEQSIVAPIAAANKRVVKDGVAAWNIGLTTLADKIQLIVAGTVLHVNSKCANVRGETEFLNSVGVESDGADDVATGVHGGHNGVLRSFLAAIGAVVKYDLCDRVIVSEIHFPPIEVSGGMPLMRMVAGARGAVDWKARICARIRARCVGSFA